MKIYIGSAVQGLSPKAYREMVKKILWLKEELGRRGHEILNYKSMTSRDSTPKEIYEHDHKNCMDCDALLAISVKPSTGLGMEIVTCLTREDEQFRRQPAFVFATASLRSNVSKLLIGWQHYAFVFKQYKSFKNIPDLLEEAYKKYREDNAESPGD